MRCRMPILIVALFTMAGFGGVALASCTGPSCVYIPVASVERTATPLPTNTPLPTFPLLNGDFEQGRDVGWAFSTNGLSPIHNIPALAHAGGWYAGMGHSQKEVDALTQNVTITADAPYLVYWSAVASEENDCTFDFAYVRSQMVGTVDSINEFCGSQEHAYRKRTVDLRRFIGLTIDLGFYMSTDGSFFSEWDIDDINLQAKP